MKNKILVALLLVAALLVSPAAAYYIDTDSVSFSGNAATLELQAGVDQSFNPSFSLGAALLPGETGQVTLFLHNKGSIPGKLCVKIQNATPDVIQFADPGICSEELAAGATRQLPLSWVIPAEYDFGEGGQPIDVSIVVSLVQP